MQVQHLSVGQPCSGLGEHLKLVLVHVLGVRVRIRRVMRMMRMMKVRRMRRNMGSRRVRRHLGVRPGGLGLRVGVDLPRLKLPGVVGQVAAVLLPLGLVQQRLVPTGWEVQIVRCQASGARRQVSGGRCKVGGARCQVSGDARVQVSHLSRHWAAVLPTMGAMVRHWVGISLARCSSFSSSSFAHSVFLIEGSSHSNHRAWGLERMRWAKRMYRLMRMKRAGHLALLGALPVEQGGDPAPLVLAVPGEG